MMYADRLGKTIDVISSWDGIDFVVKFIRTGQSPMSGSPNGDPVQATGGPFLKAGAPSKPVAIVLEPSILPEEAKGILNSIEECVFARLPVYYSFAGAANALNLVLGHNESRACEPGGRP